MTLDQIMANLSASDEEIRRQAVVAMRHYPLSRMAESIRSALGDASWRVRKEAVDLVLSAAPDERFIFDLVEMLRSEENAGLRNSAVEVLERLGSRAVPVLHRFSADPDHDVRKFIIDIMGSIRDASFVQVLVEALRDSDANVSSAAAENLGKIGDDRAIEPLLQSLDRCDMMFRYTVLQSLGRIGRQIPLAPLIPLMDDPHLKKAIFVCLGAVGDVSAAAALIDGMTLKTRSAREAAVTALYRLYRRLSAGSERKAVEEGLRRHRGVDAMQGLVTLLESDNRDVRESAIWAAGLIGDDRFIVPLMKSCQSEEVRSACIAALTRLGSDNMQGLVALYPGASVDDRCLIVHLVGETGYRDGSAIVTAALRDDSSVLKRIAAVAAGKIWLHGLVPEIACLLDEEDVRLRSGAIESLGQLAVSAPREVHEVAVRLAGGDLPQRRKEAVSLLLVLKDIDRLALLAKDEDASVRCMAVQALAGVDAHDITGHLVMALVDEDASVRIAAAGALGAKGGGEAVHALLLALQDEDPWVQCAAVKSLGGIGDRVALPAITELLVSSDGLVVIEALHALSRIDAEKSRGTIVAALDNGDADIVKAAIDILMEGGDDRWIDARCDMLLAHPDWDVRCRFIRLFADRRGDDALPLLKLRLSCETDEMVRALLNDILGRGL